MGTTLETLMTTERPGYGDRPTLRFAACIEQWHGARYVELSVAADGERRRTVSVRQRELPGLIAALQRAQERICDAPESFTEGMTHAEYAASAACPIR